MEREFKHEGNHVRVRYAIAEGEFNDLIEGIDVYVNGIYRGFLAETSPCDSNEVIMDSLEGGEYR